MLALLDVKANREFLPVVWMRELSTIALSLPFSTAIVETAFSVMNVGKNFRTNGMHDDVQRDLLQVCLNGPPEMSVCPFFCVRVFG
jgi:hypothetical protein